MNNQPELLSPAGSYDALVAALRFGADAVYVGGELLQLRAAYSAFPPEKLAEAIALVHAREKKIYIAVNALATNADIDALPDYARFLSDAGADAVIVSDLGVLATVKRVAPQLAVHISTQASCMNFAAARQYHDLGAERIVLAREMRLEEIAALRAKTPATLELEAFVHGAMCMAHSGRCIISSALLGRSGNRGDCAQPCRWNYHLVEEKRPGEFFPIEEAGGRTAILSSMDLCCIEHLPELFRAGISSFKIEGRMKTEFYVAIVTGAYRRAMDGSAPLALCRAELDTVSHRPYTTGFLMGELPEKHANSGAYLRNYAYVGKVLGWGDGRLTVEQRGKFVLGDVLEIVSPQRMGAPLPVTAICNEAGEPQESAPHAKQIVHLPCDIPLEQGDMLRLKKS